MRITISLKRNTRITGKYCSNCEHLYMWHNGDRSCRHPQKEGHYYKSIKDMAAKENSDSDCPLYKRSVWRILLKKGEY